MLNLLFVAASLGLAGYVLLWLAGAKLPGTGTEPFKGWIFSDCTDPDDDLRRTRA